MARTTLSKKELLGQYYTPPSVARFMIALSSQDRTGAVCDAGFGQGVFLDALLEAGWDDPVGYDVDPESYKKVIARLNGRAELRCLNFLASPSNETFNLIVGNPPYVKWNNIDPNTRALLASPFWRRLVNGEWDLLYAFIVWSCEKLEEGGELIFIVPYNWFNATYARSLRSYLVAHGSFEEIVHFSEYKLFTDCAPNVIIFKWRKGAPKRPYIRVAEYEGRRGEIDTLLEQAKRGLESFDGQEEQKEFRDGEWRFFTAQHMPPDDVWHLASPEEEEKAHMLEAACTASVGELFDVGVGAVPGYDAAFHLSEEEWTSIPEKESPLVIEMVKPVMCERYRMAKPHHYIFADSVIDEMELRSSYPHLYTHLMAHKERLAERYGAKECWWHWATPRNLALFRRHAYSSKIFVPGIDRSPRSRFSIISAPVYGSGDTVCVAPRAQKEDMLYVLGWLNSEALGAWYRVKGARMGHRTRYLQGYITRLPYRAIDFSSSEERGLHNEVVKGVRRVLSLDVGSETRTQAEVRIERAIKSLLDLAANS